MPLIFSGAFLFLNHKLNIEMKNTINWNDFMKVEMYVGTILSANEFPEAINPSFQLKIDFGDLGIKKTSAQITDLYEAKKLIGKQVVAVLNFPPKQIANMMSECLVLGAVGDKKVVTLLQPERNVPNGTRVA